MPPFPPMPPEFEATRSTLHAYAQAIGVLPRAHAVAHPKWWHISLAVHPTGLVSDSMALPEGGAFEVRMDLVNHVVVAETTGGKRHEIAMTDGVTGTEMGERLIAIAAEFGLDGTYPREKFANDEPRDYDQEAAVRFLQIANDVVQVFRRHSATLDGVVGPIQLWPHGFDLAMEWYGTRVETYEEDGEVQEYPSQLNLGFYPGGEPYFYSNPWPFDEALTGKPLPAGARWHTEGWQGTMLPYSEVAGAADAAERIFEFAQAVYAVASPTLLA